MGSGTALANGESRMLAKGIKLDAVPAYNTTPGHAQFHPKGRDNGYVLTIDGLRIYVAGDTEDIPGAGSTCASGTTSNGRRMKDLRDTFRDMTPDEMREASRDAEIASMTKNNALIEPVFDRI